MLNTNKTSILKSHGLLKVTGDKAKDLLQGQLTCDLNEINSTTTRMGAHCNPQGRIISLFRVIFFQNHYYLLMPKSLIPNAINGLKKYAIFYKVQFEDVSDQFECIGYIGQQLNPVPQNPNELIPLDDGFIFKITAERYEIIRKFYSTQVNLPEKTSEISENDWKYLDLIAGFPTIYPETSEKFLPHEINLPALGGVSFNKGCYTGQEIIARMQYRGKLKTELLSTEMTSEIPPVIGDPIVDFCQTGYNSYQVLMITSKK